eukprot:maker-scaffold879_size85478-snap-gene-0.18 protein:Tk11984 transcript:maker-scaffold879_size85478-snap-gene-0.18-mRNA-1 annotation:"hypothetical protein DAPPUDRAFT_302941"
MSKSVAAKVVTLEPLVYGQVEGLCVHLKTGCGWVLGHRNAQGGMKIIHLAVTPTEMAEESEGRPGIVQRQAMPLERIDQGWMMEHHDQMLRLLPGGIDILGVFLVDGTDLLIQPEMQAIVQQILQSLNRARGGQVLDSVVIHCDQRIGRAHYQLQDGQSNARPQIQELKITAAPQKWQKLEGTFLLDLPCAFDMEQTSQLLQKKIDIALKPLEQAVERSIILFDGIIRPDSDCLDPAVMPEKSTKGGKSHKGKKGHKHKRVEESSEDEEEPEEDREEGELKTYQLQILVPDEFESINEVLTRDKHSRMKMVGKMAIACYLPPTATIAEAKEAVRTDIKRSLRGRCQLHCDSLVGEETKGTEREDAPALHEPPRRILVRLPASDVCISDYLYPGENSEDSIDSVQELFGFRARIDHIDDEQELVASPQEAMSSSDSEENSAAQKLSLRPSEMTAARCGPILLLVSFAVAACSLGLAYYFMFNSSNPADLDELVEDDTFLGLSFSAGGTVAAPPPEGSKCPVYIWVMSFPGRPRADTTGLLGGEDLAKFCV